ncbi:MAG: AI-2E family transporter [Clostridia bacterium]|nr:AI-2E family transporter [Clostridia bacterium]
MTEEAKTVKKLRVMWRASRRWLFIVIVGILFYELLEHFSVVRFAFGKAVRVMTPIFVGFGLAYIVNIPSTILQRTVFKKHEGKRFAIVLSNIIAYIFVAGIAALLVLLIVPRAIDGVRMLLSNAENYYNGLVAWLEKVVNRLDLNEAATAKAVEMSQTLVDKIEAWTLATIPKLLNITVSTVGVLANALLAVAFSVYVLADKNRLLAHARRFIRAVFSEKNAERILEVCTFSNATYRGYFAGQLTSSLIIGIMCYIGMRIFGMPYPEMIAVFISAFALIPILGPWISTLPSAFIILMASPDKPLLALWFIVMVLVIQQIDNNFIYPRVVGNAVGLSSAWVLFGVLVGGGLFGVIGLLFAVPTTAVIYRLVADWTNARARSRGVPIVDSVPHEFDSKRRKAAARRRFFSGRAKKKKEDVADGKGEHE